MDKKFEDKFESVDKRFDAMDKNFEAIDARMDLMGKKIDFAVVQASVITSSIGILAAAIGNNKLDDTLKRFEDQKESLQKEFNGNARSFAAQGSASGAIVGALAVVALFHLGHGN